MCVWVFSVCVVCIWIDIKHSCSILHTFSICALCLCNTNSFISIRTHQNFILFSLHYIYYWLSTWQYMVYAWIMCFAVTLSISIFWPFLAHIMHSYMARRVSEWVVHRFRRGFMNPGMWWYDYVNIFECFAVCIVCFQRVRSILTDVVLYSLLVLWCFCSYIIVLESFSMHFLIANMLSMVDIVSVYCLMCAVVVF